MAKQKTNLSQAVRDYLKANRKAKAKEVVEALAKQGITVQEGLVYAVKGKIKGKRKKRLAVAAMITPAPSSNGTVMDPLTLIKKTKELAAQAGGMKKLRELLEMLG